MRPCGPETRCASSAQRRQATNFAVLTFVLGWAAAAAERDCFYSRLAVIEEAGDPRL